MPQAIHAASHDTPFALHHRITVGQMPYAARHTTGRMQRDGIIRPEQAHD